MGCTDCFSAREQTLGLVGETMTSHPRLNLRANKRGYNIKYLTSPPDSIRGRAHEPYELGCTLI